MVEFTVVIPTLNEEEQIEKTVHGTFANLKKLKLNPEVIIVDDSEDKTYDILKKLMKQYKDLKVIHRDMKKGIGSATRLGIERAKGKYIIVFMGDAPEDTKYFPAMLEKLRQGYDIAQTSRFLKGCKMIRYPFKKRVCNWLCNNFIKIAFLEFKIKDFSSLFKSFRKDKIESLNLEANEFDLSLEIILKAMRKKYKVAEVPVDWVERESGKSKLKLSRYAPDYFKRVMKIWLGL